MVVKEGGFRSLTLQFFTPISSETIWCPRYGLIVKEILLYKSLLFSKKDRVLGNLP
jgi:hypothetical protein